MQTIAFLLNADQWAHFRLNRGCGAASRMDERQRRNALGSEDTKSYHVQRRIRRKLAVQKIASIRDVLHAEGMKNIFEGEILFNGKRYIVVPEKCFGYADKNWGRNFTTPWVWLSSNNLTSVLTGKKLKNSIFGIGGGHQNVGYEYGEFNATEPYPRLNV